MIAEVRGRLAAKQGDRILVQTPGGVGYEIVVPLGVMERLPAVGADVAVATELVVREDGWALYGFSNGNERQFFQRLTSVSGVGPRLAVSLMSALGVTRAARAILDRDIAVLSSVSGIGKKTAERLVLELAEKVGAFTEAPEGLGGAAGTARKALEGLGYSAAEADRAVREALAANGGSEPADALVRRALGVLAET